MDSNEFQIIKTGKLPDCSEAIKRFVKKHEKSFEFTKFYENGQWFCIWSRIIEIINDVENNHGYYPECLAALRILSRYRENLTDITSEQYDCLLNIANIGPTNFKQCSTDESIEVLKCLCNLVYQNETEWMSLRTVESIFHRLKTYENETTKYDLHLYDLKLLFLMTALNEKVRPKIDKDCEGIICLIDLIRKIIDQSKKSNNNIRNEEIDLLLEVLKILFNLTMCKRDPFTNSVYIYNNKEIATTDDLLPFDRVYRLMIANVKALFTLTPKDNQIQMDLYSKAVHLLTNIPIQWYHVLAPLIEPKNDSNKNLMLLGVEEHVPTVKTTTKTTTTEPVTTTTATIKEPLVITTITTEAIPFTHINHMIPNYVDYEEHDLTVIHFLLNFLTAQLDNAEKQPLKSSEKLSPILMVLIKCARGSRIQRRYIRSVILPPLKDVKERPEVGNSLRNKLCRSLTKSTKCVRDLAAELLFVICKENVWRMTKYTGYGNAAGLFANRGLICGQEKLAGSYSSDSENSDTEEYKSVEHGINPVLGCYEPPRPSPFEGMTEEQKEHEAMKLVELMDKLNRQGIVQPCRIGEDGRPVPVDHILQLQDDLPKQQTNHKRKI